jgi:NAD-dependent dihydropyrimidine dehydrogenase PreA subunit
VAIPCRKPPTFYGTFSTMEAIQCEEGDLIMIYYFSGTGNSKWIAEQLALKTGDLAVNMVECSGVLSIDNQTIGIVFPIHAWGVPEAVQDFVKKLVGKPAFTFGVCSCGDEAGYAMEKLNSLIPLNNRHSVAMPSNYVIGADVESDEIIASKIATAKDKVETIAAQVISKHSVVDVNKGKLPWIKSNLANYGFNKFARSTKPFYITDKCTSCGQCAENCPSKTIMIIEGKPKYLSEKCYMCTACINRCPAKAIEYGKATSPRSRYQFKEY